MHAPTRAPTRALKWAPPWAPLWRRCATLLLQALLASVWLAGCGEPAAPEEVIEEEEEPPRCGTASRDLPDQLVTLLWDNGTPFSDISQHDWTVEEAVLRDEPLNEAVRFDVEQPALIHGFSVQWTSLPDPEDAEAEIFAGLYPDFGHNGFDFWQVPIWSGSRCRGDIEPGEWADYVFPEPIEIAHPTPVYVAHRRDGPGAPTFLFDGDFDGEGDCATFSACHSAMNLPFHQTDSYYNGLSISFPHDFMVRLHLSYTDEVAPSETFFQPLAPEVTIGSRHSFGDFDRDGDDDLLTDARLLRNDGGRFTDVTEAAGLVDATISGGVWGDYDNDGCLDLFAIAQSAAASDSLWHSSCDGTFENVTAAVGIDDRQDEFLCNDDPAADRQPTHAAAWWDIDADGFIDLYVPNYSCGAIYYRDQVFHNLGDGTFEEWSGQHGFSDAALASRGANPADVDGDGDVDLLVNTYRLQPNLFFENRGDGTVVESAVARNLVGHADRVGSATAYGHTIGVAWGDLDGDGDLDLVEANLAHPRFFGFSDKTRVLLNDGTGSFTDIAGDWSEPVSDAGLRYQETHSVPLLADFDHDGVLDLVLSAVYDGRPTDFYWGNGDGTFALDAYHAGITVTDGWGMAAADWDNDGDVDLVAKGRLFENRRDDDGHWLQVRAVGTDRCNRSALGATVRVVAGEMTHVRLVPGGGAQGNQDSATLHFGLADAAEVDRVEVDFPGAGTVSFPGPFDADQRLWLFEDGTSAVGWIVD